MGLNINHRFFLNNTQKENMPNYTPSYKAPVFTEAYMLDKITKYNLNTRHAMNEMSSLTECGVYTDAVNGTLETLNNVINNTREVKTTLVDFLNQTINSLKADVKCDDFDTQYKPFEKTEILRKALRDCDTSSVCVNCASIIGSADLLSEEFPNTDAIGDKLSNMTSDALNNEAIKMFVYKADQDQEASESLADKVNNIQDEVINNLLNNKYEYDKTDITGSSIKASDAAFGSSAREDNGLTVDLYGRACYNLDADKEKAINILTSDRDKVERNYNMVISCLDNIKNDTLKIMEKIPKDYSVSIPDAFNAQLSKIVGNVNSIINVLQTSINMNYKMIMNKAIRINQIYNPDPAYGDSAKIKHACIALMKKYQNVPDETPISGIQSAQEANDMLNEFESAMAIMEEVMEDYNISANTILPINEDNNLSSGSSETQVQNKINAAAGALNRDPNVNEKSNFNLIDKTIDKLTAMWHKAVDRITSFLTTGHDQAFWNNNRESLKNIDYGKSTGNQWYRYTIDNFKVQIIDDNLDVTKPELKDDNTFADYILGKYTQGTAETKEDNTFNDKMKKKFYSEYIDKENGELLNNLMNDPKIFGFVDDFVRNQFNGDTLGKCNDEFEKLNKQYKDAKANIKTLTDKYEDTYGRGEKDAQKPGENQNSEPQAKTTGASEAKAESGSTAANGNGSNGVDRSQLESKFDLDDFRFNLAEHFCLLQNMDTPVMDLLAEATDIDPNAIQDSEGADGRKDSQKDCMDAINRYFKYNSFALTTKMTSIFGAYKQYMDTYKAIKGIHTKNTDEMADDNQKNNGNNQQNNQNQNK